MKIQRAKLLKLSLIGLFCSWVVVYYLNGSAVNAFSLGPPDSHTGASALGTFPAEPTCVDCHSSFPLNSGPGLLSISGLPANYVLGQEVALTVTLMQPNRMHYGFEATVLDDLGMRAGELVITDEARTQLVDGTGSFAGRQYIEQTFAGVTANGTDQNSWTFTWRAPAQNVGRVTFYVAGNAANGDGSNQGDFIYTINANVLPVAQTNGLQFYPLPRPIRLLDTRPGQVGCDAPGLPIPGNTSRTQTIAGRTCDGITIPAAARAITGNITTVDSGGGFLTLYPSDAQQPTVASTNYGVNEIINNVFTVGLGADGAFKIFAHNTTNVVVDVTGYYAPPSANGLYFHPLPSPIRLLETRAGLPVGCFKPGTPLPGGVDTIQQVTGVACVGIPATARAIVGNATTVGPQGGGFLTIFPADAARPLVASSNFYTGQIVNGPFAVGLAANGQFKIFTTTTTDLVVDVLGYYSAEATDVNGAGLLFNPLPKPVRLLETRPGQLGCTLPGVPVAGGVEQTQQARGVCQGETIPNVALVMVGTATVVFPAGPGFLTLWPNQVARPTVATSNYSSGQIVNRHFTVGLGEVGGAFKIFSSATTDLVIDVAGYFAP